MQGFAQVHSGVVIAQIPSMGYYVVGVTPGNESGFIATANSNSLVQIAIPGFPLASQSDVDALPVILGPNGELPTIPIIGAQVGNNTYLYVPDDYVNANGICGITHGAEVDFVASTNLSGTGLQMDVHIPGNDIYSFEDVLSASQIAISNNFTPSSRTVVNLSEAAPDNDDPDCASDETNFLGAIARQLHSLPANILAQTVIVVAAGNGCSGVGVDLSACLYGLHNSYPDVFGLGGGPHMIVAGGEGTAAGTINSNYNYCSVTNDANGNPLMIYAPASNVLVGNDCYASGTSYAAPAISGMIAQLLAANTNLTVGQATRAVMQGALNNTSHYWLPDIGTIQQTITDLFYSTLTINPPAGTGSGTVGVNPPGLTYTSGTVVLTYTNGTIVTLTANPATGSTFVGWNGDASDSSLSTQVTMNGNKSVTATFAASGVSVSITSATCVQGPGDGCCIYTITLAGSACGPVGTWLS